MRRNNKPNRLFIGLSIITILILTNWINNLYDDINDIDFKIEVSCIRDSSMTLSNIEKDRIIDSFRTKRKEEPVVIIKPKYNKKIKVDTINPIQDTFNILPINIKSIEDTTKQ